MNGYPDLDEQMERLHDIGTVLSSERNFARLLELIVEEARNLTHADGGTLYLVSDGRLEFKVVQTESLKIRRGGASGEPIRWVPVPLSTVTGKPNYAHVSARAALQGEIINIPDVYKAKEYDFRGTRAFDNRTRYLSRSMLVVPMRDHDGTITGVLQLLNAKDPATGAVVPFPASYESLVESLANQAAVAIDNLRLGNDTQQP